MLAVCWMVLCVLANLTDVTQHPREMFHGKKARCHAKMNTRVVTNFHLLVFLLFLLFQLLLYYYILLLLFILLLLLDSVCWCS